MSCQCAFTVCLSTSVRTCSPSWTDDPHHTKRILIYGYEKSYRYVHELVETILGNNIVAISHFSTRSIATIAATAIIIVFLWTIILHGDLLFRAETRLVLRVHVKIIKTFRWGIILLFQARSGLVLRFRDMHFWNIFYNWFGQVDETPGYRTPLPAVELIELTH